MAYEFIYLGAILAHRASCADDLGEKMGNPYAFAIEVPVRAHTLLMDLWPAVEGKDYPQFGGPLATTFLVALAGPIITFPYERLHKPTPSKNERGLRTVNYGRFNAIIDTEKLSETPFFAEAAWRYFHSDGKKLSVVSIPGYVLKGLNADDAEANAASVKTKEWLGALRNALAHSAIAYLDKDGQQIVDAPVEMIAFVSQHWEDDKLVGHHVFRIGRDDFRQFLDAWAQWLVGG